MNSLPIRFGVRVNAQPCRELRHHSAALRDVAQQEVIHRRLEGSQVESLFRQRVDDAARERGGGGGGICRRGLQVAHVCVDWVEDDRGDERGDEGGGLDEQHDRVGDDGREHPLGDEYGGERGGPLAQRVADPIETLAEREGELGDNGGIAALVRLQGREEVSEVMCSFCLKEKRSCICKARKVPRAELRKGERRRID